MHYRIPNNYRDDPPAENVEEMMIWGQKVFSASCLLLNGDPDVSNAVTDDVLVGWDLDLSLQRGKKRLLKFYKTRPDSMLKNRYHLLQQRLFRRLEITEKEQEVESSVTVGITLPDWLLYLRYIKAIFERTANISEERLVATCYLLREYSYAEVADIAEVLYSSRSTPVDYGEGAFLKMASKRFGGRSRPLIDRFSPYFEPADDPRSVKGFKLGDLPEEKAWLSTAIATNLAPWGLELNPAPENEDDGIGDYLERLDRPIDEFTTTETACSVDEARMLVLSICKYFAKFLERGAGNQPLKAKPKAMRVPILKTSSSSSSEDDKPDVTYSWDENRLLRVLVGIQQSKGVQRKGHHARSLVVRANTKLARSIPLSASQVPLSVSIPTNDAGLIGIFYETEVGETLIYEFYVDFDEIYETGEFRKKIRGIGGQWLSVVVRGKIQDEELIATETRLTYREPFSWRWRRRWAEASGFEFILRSPVEVGAFAILLFGILLGAFYLATGPVEEFSRTDLLTVDPPEVDSSPIMPDRDDEESTPPGPEYLSNSDDRNNGPRKSESEKKTRKQRLKSRPEPTIRVELQIDPTTTALTPRRAELDPRLATLPLRIGPEAGRGNTSGANSLTSPNGTYVRPGAVIFQWAETPGADHYYFELWDSNDVPIKIGTVKGTAAGVEGVEAGKSFLWTVSSRSDQGLTSTVSKGIFRTLPQNVANDVKKELFNDLTPLKEVEIYMRYGLLDEAEDALPVRPGGSKSEKFLRQRLQQMRAGKTQVRPEKR